MATVAVAPAGDNLLASSYSGAASEPAKLLLTNDKGPDGSVEESANASGEEDADGVVDDEVDGDEDDGEEGDKEDGDDEENDEEDEADGNSSDEDASAEDAEGESEEEAEGSPDEHEAVGAVKVPDGVQLNSEEEGEAEESSEGSDSSRGDDQDEDGAESGSSNSVAEEWEDASAGDVEAETAVRNNCVFCKQSEEEDPSEDFEEYLTCARCGDHAHQQCAREDNCLTDGEDIKAWRCLDCFEVDGESDADEDSKQRRQSTASQVPKDLLPAPRGGIKPGAHSIFNDLIIDEDPLDGSRPLRKRKASSEALESQSRASSKRPKSAGSSRAVSEARSLASSTVEKQRSRRNSADKEIIESARLGDTLAAESSPSRSARPRRQKIETGPARLVEKVGKKKLVLAMRVDLSQIKKSSLQKKYKRSMTLPYSHSRISHLPITQYSSPFYSLHNNEMDESKNKPYGGILTETQADTSRTFPVLDDRAKFDEARRKHEEEWQIKTAAIEAESELKNRASTKVSGPPSKIKCINFGGFEIDTWYAAPYPEEYSRNRVLFICEFCLKYMPSDYVAWRHKLKCPAKHPPGDEIYRDVSISVFEVDGRKNPVYCQNLCLLAKLFLGSKTLYYDVEPFLFYIMTEYDDFGYHFVGYFSKEKRPSSMNNVSCILTLPIHQRKGYGNLLIDFSYLLTRCEQKTGSPEKPLSDMGLVSYRNYWRLVLARTLLDQRHAISIGRISDITGMTADDIIAGLEAIRALVRDPITKSYALRIDRTFLRETIDNWETKKYVTLNPDALIWTPYIMGRNNLASYDRGAPISTVAPREDDDEPATATILAEEGVQAELQRQAKAKPRAEPHPKLNGTADANSTAPAELQLDATLAGDQAAAAAAATAADSTDLNGGSPHKPPATNAPIPPIRFEIYPPIPGSIVRRKYQKGGLRRSLASPADLTGRRLGRPPNSARLAVFTPMNADSPTTPSAAIPAAEASGTVTPNGRRTRRSLADQGAIVPEGFVGNAAGVDEGAAALAAGEGGVNGEDGAADEEQALAEGNDAAFALNQDAGVEEDGEGEEVEEEAEAGFNGVVHDGDAAMVDT